MTDKETNKRFLTFEEPGKERYSNCKCLILETIMLIASPAIPNHTNYETEKKSTTKAEKEMQYKHELNVRLATANRSRVSILGQPCKNFPDIMTKVLSYTPLTRS